MDRPEWVRLPRGVRWNACTGIASAAGAVLGIIAMWSAFLLLGSVFTFGSSSNPSEAYNEALQRHDVLATNDRKRFDGRSAFFMPSPPVRKTPKVVKPIEPPKPPPPPPGPPPPPREYAGPRPTAAVGSLIFFADNSRIRVGEESGGTRVLATNAPWSVKLGHSGGEYDVPLWSKGKEEFFNGDWKTLKGSVPGIEPVTGSGTGATGGGTKTSVVTETGMQSPPGSIPNLPTPAPPGPSGGPTAPAAGPGMPAPTGVPTASQGRGWDGGHSAAPPALGSEQIHAMSMTETQAALQTVARARLNRNLDDPTRDRLNQEFEDLSNRMKELSKGQSGPG